MITSLFPLSCQMQHHWHRLHGHGVISWPLSFIHPATVLKCYGKGVKISHALLHGLIKFVLTVFDDDKVLQVDDVRYLCNPATKMVSEVGDMSTKTFHQIWFKVAYTCIGWSVNALFLHYESLHDIHLRIYIDLWFLHHEFPDLLSSQHRIAGKIDSYIFPMLWKYSEHLKLGSCSLSKSVRLQTCSKSASVIFGTFTTYPKLKP